MAEPSALEQYFHELVNRARQDPLAEAQREGIDLNEGLAAGTISATSKAPLAFSATLIDAARGHSNSMLAGNYFSHTSDTGTSATDRIFAAGWDSATNGFATGENISFRASTDSANGQTMETIDAHHSGLFQSSGHRTNILNETFSEIGIGQSVGAFTTSSGTTFPFTSMATQNFADGGRTFLTGVIIDDQDGDRFYDVGEGLGGVSIMAVGVTGTFSAVSWGSGGYSLELVAGTYSVTLSGGDLGGVIVQNVTIGEDNVKLDGIKSDAAGSGVASGTFTGTSGNDTFIGGANVDTVVMGANRADATVSISGAVTTATGPAIGSDHFTNIERLQFNDGTLAVDIEGASAQVYRLYQAAFDRAPDTVGLKHNVELFDGGLTLQELSGGFIASTEFIGLYGASPSDTAFVTALYFNVLDRAPDAPGLADWIALLADGSQSRETVLIGFSESDENMINIAPAIADGIWLG